MRKKTKFFLQKVSIIVIFLLSTFYGFSQYPRNYFRSPIPDSTLHLAGNFGEIRPNHFHAGLDIRTDNKEGMKVFAIGDGYVSRIKISATGYGKCLYITHPNGYVSVYGHLRNYNDIIGKYAKDSQYKMESFEIEVFPKENDIPVRKGELVAFSGNTGGSSGPHLHFEMRDEKTESAINPLLFGFNVKDIIKPVIKNLYLYQFDDTIYQESICDKNTLPKKFELSGTNGFYQLLKQNTLLLGKNSGLGIDVFDQQSGSPNQNGIYSIELMVDNKSIYFQEMEKVTFEESRDINSHIDYYEQKVKSKSIQKSFVAHNNNLKIYKDIKNMGIINFSDSNLHKIKYVVRDIKGNTSTLEFNAKRNLQKDKPKFPVTCVAVFDCKKDNQFKRGNIAIDFPKNTFYEDLKFDFSQSKDTLKGAYSPTYHIHNRYVPVHSYYNIQIKSKAIKNTLQSKAFLVSVDEKGRKTYEGGLWRNDSIIGQTRTFGNFAVFMDTLAPIIKPLNIAPDKNMKDVKRILIAISDNLSGIKSYRATIDGQWILMEYEPRQHLLFCDFSEKVNKGKHIFKLEVSDKRENKALYKVSFMN